MDDELTAPNANQQLKQLTAQLEAAQKKGTATQAVEGAPSSPPAANPEIFMGLTFGGLMAGLIWSAVGVGMVRYAKVTGQFVWGVCGALLFVLPIVVTDTWALVGGGAVIVGLAFGVRRFVTF